MIGEQSDTPGEEETCAMKESSVDMDMNNHKTGESNTKRITNERKKGRGRMRLFNIKSKGRRQGIEHQQ